MELTVVALLMLLGIILLVVEIALIPGVGLTGVLGVASLVASVSYAFIALGTWQGWACVLVATVIGVALFLWAVYGKTLDRVALKKKINSTVENPEATALKVGDKGVAVARLALIGEADFNGSRVEVRSCEGFIDEGTAIEVVRINNAEIIVRKAQ